VAVGETNGAPGGVEAENLAVFRDEFGRDDHRAILADRDEPAVEGRVEVRGKQKAVEDIESLGVRLAIRPGSDVAGPQQFDHRQAGNSAAALPVLEEAITEDVPLRSRVSRDIGQ